MGRPIRDQPFRPSDLRRAVSEWAAQGLSVTIKPSGEIVVTPPSIKPDTDPFDAVDFTR